MDWLSAVCIVRAGLGASTVSSAATAGSAGAPTLGAAKDDIDRLRISVRWHCCCLVFESLPVGYTARVNDLLTLPALTTA
jgi:hypothetical protein